MTANATLNIWRALQFELGRATTRLLSVGENEHAAPACLRRAAIEARAVEAQNRAGERRPVQRRAA